MTNRKRNTEQEEKKISWKALFNICFFTTANLRNIQGWSFKMSRRLKRNVKFQGISTEFSNVVYAKLNVN